MISVLIVDDEKLVRTTLHKIIPWKDIGIDAVYEAEDGQRGLALVDKYSPSIIISDIKMPHMNGMDFARNVRDQFSKSRFVFLSGYTDKEYLKGAIDLHVDGYIEKPLNPQEITGLLKKLVSSCKEDERSKHPDIFFYRSNSDTTTLNQEIFTLSKSELAKMNQYLRQNNAKETLPLLHTLCDRMRQCEGTAPDYIRNVFSRLVLQMESAAELHGAIETQKACEQYANAVASFGCLDLLEKELFKIVSLYFDEVTLRDFDPVILANDYLKTNYTNSDISIKSISHHLNFSTSYLCTIYKQKTGRTINTVLTAMRMELACKLLCESNLKLYEIGSRVGYPNGKYFTKIFTKEFGISPRQYRERHDGK